MKVNRIFIKQKAFEGLRWVVAISFFFLALAKSVLLFKYGLEPYRIIVSATKLPGIVSYYGVVAIMIEIYLAIGLWMESQYLKAIFFAAILTMMGIALSLFFVAFKINSECGCGLLGDSEWGLLFQKVVIMIALITLAKKKKVLQF